MSLRNICTYATDDFFNIYIYSCRLIYGKTKSTKTTTPHLFPCVGRKMISYQNMNESAARQTDPKPFIPWPVTNKLKARTFLVVFLSFMCTYTLHMFAFCCLSFWHHEFLSLYKIIRCHDVFV